MLRSIFSFALFLSVFIFLAGLPALSSILLLGSPGEGSSANSQLSVDHVFDRKRELLYSTFVYNAADIADLQGQVTMLQNGQVIAAGKARKIIADKDQAR